MRFLKPAVLGFVLLAALCSQAEYEAEITFINGAKRTVDELVVQSGKVILAKENLQVPFAQIQSVNVTFSEPLTVEECDVFLKRGAYDEMLSRLDSFLEPVKSALEIPGNLDVYVQYKMRAGFWAGKYNDVQAAANMLRSAKSVYAPLADLYDVLVMLEQNKPAPEITAAFAKIKNPEAASGAVTEYIRGRLAMRAREYETALKHFSTVLVYHGRDPEWVPAATFQEGSVYKRTGYLESAANVAEELKIAYPDSYWGRRADELK